ncbi:alpha/beta hydrolase [Synechococcus sp. PCC 7336]|uniref:alpha/beta hydrolase n=1 Tax=Synechococcus sp. PCC 7336 TaxID=195250 RepID=UPI00034AC0B2|nr:alpha/beta fold hydrolase [Synechococcus sp. PCC 7336]
MTGESTQLLEALELAPQFPSSSESEAIAQVVCLHGWGDNARGFMPLASSLGLPHCRFWFPNAPFPHPQTTGGRAWFDLNNWNGLEVSVRLLRNWLLDLERHSGIPISKTVLLGFSQGGAMTLKVGLELEPRLAGAICLSGFLTGSPQLRDRSSPPPPVLMLHGKRDPVVLLDYAHQAKRILEALEVPLDYFELDAGHELPAAAIGLMQQFLKRLSART